MYNKTKFSQMIELQRGFDLPKYQMSLGAVPVIGSTGIIGYHNESKIKGPGVITGRSGTIGLVNYSSEDFWPHNTSLWVKDFKGNEPRFIYYYLKLINLNNYKTGASVPTLNRNALDNIDVSLPNITIQKRIANILSNFDNLIENNLKRIKLLEELGERIYKKWFIDFEFPDYENCEFIDGIPVGWEIKKINNIGEIITGKTPSKKNKDYYGKDVMFIKTPDLHNQIFINQTEDNLSILGADSQANKYLPKNAICFSCIGTIGAMGIVSEISQTNQQINSIILNDLNHMPYYYYVLKGLKDKLKGYGKGATMDNINKTLFGEVGFLSASSKIIGNYAEKIMPMFDLINVLEKESKFLQESRDRLLPKLMNGKIEL